MMVRKGKPKGRTAPPARRPERLTQAVFAKLLVAAMDALDLSNVYIAKRTGIDPTTVSRYRSLDYAPGPPPALKRGAIELAMGVPEGYLSGRATADFAAIRRLQEAHKADRMAALTGVQEPRVNPVALGLAYQTALVALSRLADADGRVPLAKAVYWVSTVHAAATGTDLLTEIVSGGGGEAGEGTTPSSVSEILAEAALLDRLPDSRPADRTQTPRHSEQA